MIQHNQKVIKMISVYTVFHNNGKAHGRFYDHDLDAGVSGDIQERQVVWDINEDGELDISHVEIVSQTENFGLKITIEVVDNGFIVSSKTKKQICDNMHQVQDFIEKEAHTKHTDKFDVESVEIDCDEAVAKYYAEQS